MGRRVGAGAGIADGELDVRFGSPTYELQQVAEDHGDGIIVMSTHGRGGLGRLVLGSVAAEPTVLDAPPLWIDLEARQAHTADEALRLARRKADAVLTKPFLNGEILSTVERLLGGRL